MKNKVGSLIIFIMSFTFIICSSAAAKNGESSAYGRDRRPYECYMKSLMSLTQDDFKDMGAIGSLLSSKNPGEEDIKKINDCGKSIYEKYKKEIDALIKDSDKLLSVKNPKPSEAQLAALRTSSRVLNFNYTRSLARALLSVSRYLASEKRHAEALKLTTLIFRFGQLVLNGDGDSPTLITAMIGIAVKNMATDGAIARLLLEGSFDKEFYGGYSEALLKMQEDEMSMNEIMNCERRFATNLIEYEVFVKSAVKNEYSQFVDKIPESQLQQGKQYALGIFSDYYDSVSVYLTRYADRPFILKDQLEKISMEISKKGEPSLWKMLNPIKSVGDILLAIAIPNFSRAYDQFLRARLYPFGAAVLSRILAEVKNGAKIPQSLAEIEKLCKIKLPPDYFNDKERTLIYKKTGDNFTLYSFGLNYKDDNAEPKDDIILFSIPQNYK